MTHEDTLLELKERAIRLLPKARAVASLPVGPLTRRIASIREGIGNARYVLGNRCDQFERLWKMGAVRIVSVQSCTDGEPLELNEQTFNREPVLEKIQVLLLTALLDEIERLVKEIENGE